MEFTRRRFVKLLAFFIVNISFKIPDIFGSIFDDSQKLLKTKIKVIGIGWAGCNIINHMSKSGINDIEYIAISSDPRILDYYDVIQNKKKIRDALAGSECVFIIAGMGGKTGTEVAPVVTQISKELDALTIGIVITPFIFEGKKND